MSSDEGRFTRSDVVRMLERRDLSDCEVRKYLQFECNLPGKIDDVPGCRPITRYFAICRDKKGSTPGVELTGSEIHRDSATQLFRNSASRSR
ncbi:hypothetical protein POJ06DRAFT_253486 [Lipomyces tetrasporus]|uniref:Uncharacterized protein n=1 Tax=Lipomyces tetrasporus TaxID=54092 RepID=A0AAD7QSL9_9ASCO|nr:uncharacterized protein POJ06DRAFT_253486 [Lipomyces tetrasporus]KAJ8100708.1 hypothetical protein POJ06DRAFT_253486 [Lipomyces tetrasporus]